MKIIDWEIKGSIARFYLGEDDCTDYHGDKWEAPNWSWAGRVYDQFVKGHVDIVFPKDMILVTSWEGSKNDMKKGTLPCMLVVPQELIHMERYKWFNYFCACRNIKAFYFNDPMELSDFPILWEDIATDIFDCKKRQEDQK